MYFGKRLKELRLNRAKKGLREFSDEMGMRPSEYSDIERGYKEPPKDSEWIFKVISALGVQEELTTQVELLNSWHEPFVMQKMPEYFMPSFVCTSSGVPLSEEKMTEFIDWMGEKVKEHNKKADEYNSKKVGK
jgi:transcriptional regulator with XRE-family HTH domain